MKVAYLAPIEARMAPNGILANIMAARAVAIELWNLGLAVICPHTNTALMDGAVPDNTVLLGDLAILGRCDCLVATADAYLSSGAQGEWTFAGQRGMPRFSWPADRERIAKYAKEGS